jgi:hypothetical protein
MPEFKYPIRNRMANKGLTLDEYEKTIQEDELSLSQSNLHPKEAQPIVVLDEEGEYVERTSHVFQQGDYIVHHRALEIL